MNTSLQLGATCALKRVERFYSEVNDLPYLSGRCKTFVSTRDDGSTSLSDYFSFAFLFLPVLRHEAIVYPFPDGA